MAEYRPCEICDAQAQYTVRQSPPPVVVTRSCPRCGEFEFEHLIGLHAISSSEEMVRLSGWVRAQNASDQAPVPITLETLHRVARMRLPGLRERANLALGLIARRCPDVRKLINLPEVAKELELLGVTYSQTSDEAMQLIHILLEDGSLRWGTTRGKDGTLTPKGLLAAEALGASGSSSLQGFVAMSFDPSLREAWTNGFDPGIRAAGFHPARIDDKDYVGGITDEIMAEIRRSRFVVADYTNQRNGVYFEAGFALGLGRTVIPTCRADEIDKLHFDIKHLNTLSWKSPAELAEGLSRRIRAVVGAGTDASPA
jgi:hypothetical protein